MLHKKVPADWTPKITMLHKIFPADWAPSDLYVHVCMCVTDQHVTKKLDMRLKPPFARKCCDGGVFCPRLRHPEEPWLD